MAATLLALTIPLALYAYIGSFTRYVVDDYETAGALQQYGFWGSQHYWYLNWSGRYTYFFIVGLVESMGVRAVPFLTITLLVLWLLGMFWALRLLGRAAGLAQPDWLAAAGALLIVFITLRSMPFIHQILFWQTGILTYVNYLVFFCIGLALLFWRLSAKTQQVGAVELAASAGYAWVIGSLSEISIAVQITFCFCAVVFFIFQRRCQSRRRGIILLSAALAGSLLAFAIIALAPGNAVRAARMPPPPGLSELAVHSLRSTLAFPLRWFTDHPELAGVAFLLPLLACLAQPLPVFSTPAWQGRRLARSVLAALVVTTLVTFFWVLAGFAISYYAMSNEPPERAQVVLQWMVTCLVAGWGCLAGSLGGHWMQEHLPMASRRRWAVRAGSGLLLALCLAVGPGYASLRISTIVAPARSWAAAWDARDAEIRAAVARGERTVVVQYLKDPTRIIDYGPDPNFWVNRGAAAYYGLESIIALEK